MIQVTQVEIKFSVKMPKEIADCAILNKAGVEVRHQSWYTANLGEEEPAYVSSLRWYGVSWAATYRFFNNNFVEFAPGTANLYNEELDLPVIQVQRSEPGKLFLERFLGVA
jgi:hypothetical protein